jgi:predicted transcriptional regulator of viral defense system
MRRKVAPVAAEIARRQHGVVARRQLLRTGVTGSAIDRLVRSGWLHPLHRGVYAVGHRAVGSHGRDLAAVLAAGPGAALGLESGAALWAMTSWRGDVQVLGRHSAKRAGFVVHRTRSLPRSDITRHYGIPVTTPARTLIDLATVVDADTLEAALAEAQIRGLIRPEALIPRATGALARALGQVRADALAARAGVPAVHRGARPAAPRHQRVRRRLRGRRPLAGGAADRRGRRLALPLHPSRVRGRPGA